MHLPPPTPMTSFAPVSYTHLLREYDRYGLRGIRLAGFFAHGTGMCACADFFGLLEQRLAEHKIQLVLIAAPETIPDGELRALQRFHRLSFCVVHTSVRVPPARREAPPYELSLIPISMCIRDR